MSIKKVFKITGIFLLSVLTALVLLIVFFWVKVEYGTEITEIQSFGQTDPYIWNKVDLGDTCKCIDGSDYWIYTKKGQSDNLIIHLQGGGACWDESSCVMPLGITNIKGFYLPRIFEWMFKAFFSHGIMKNNFEANPFKDWNIVFIPYCTADLHIGNSENIYTDSDGNDILVKHIGRTNVKSALHWIRNNIHDPDKVFITGESAGGYGSIFWTPEIVRMFQTSKFYQLSDCSFEKSQVLLDAVLLWNAETEKVLGFKTYIDIINGALFQYSDSILKNTDIIFFQSYSKFDEIALRFDAAINNRDSESSELMYLWSNEMLTAVKQNSDSLNNYYYYITKWNQKKNGKTPHTFLLLNPFYECIEDEVYYSEWLKEGVINDQPFSVGSLEPGL
jgi:hypothetical protein